MRNSLPPLDSCGLLLRYRLKQPLKSWVSVGCRVSNLMFYGALPIKIFGICSSLVTVQVSATCFGCTKAIVRHHLAQMLAELAAFWAWLSWKGHACTATVSCWKQFLRGIPRLQGCYSDWTMWCLHKYCFRETITVGICRYVNNCWISDW